MLLGRRVLLLFALLVVGVCGWCLSAEAESDDRPEGESRIVKCYGENDGGVCGPRRPEEEDSRRTEQEDSDDLPEGESEIVDCEGQKLGRTRRGAFPIICPDTPPLGGESPGFQPLDQWMIGDTTQIGLGGMPGCSQAIHDLYVTTGPDGRLYRTWHALWHPKVKGELLRRMATWEEMWSGKNDPECYFAHEHGQPPLALANPRSGAPLPAFGYGAVMERAINPARVNIEPHPGFKVFTHLAGGRTGWRQQGPVTLNPDWDMEVMIHQGSPSLHHLPGTPPISTRVTQRRHELSFWTRDGKGAITHVIKMSDTGTVAFRGYSAGGRVIATDKEPMDEVWAFEARVGDPVSPIFDLTFPAAILNPMNHYVGVPPTDSYAISKITSEHFASSSEKFGGLEVYDAMECFEANLGATQCQTAPFGSQRVYPDGFMGTVRTLDGMTFKWNNTTGQGTFCTNPYGTPYGSLPDMSACEAGAPGALVQRVAPIVLVREAEGPGGSWTNVMTTEPDERLAFPVMTNDPAKPWDAGKSGRCKAESKKSDACLPRIPQDFVLGN